MKKNQTVRRVLLRMRSFRVPLLTVLLLAIVSVGCSLVIPVLTGQAVDEVVAAGQVRFAPLKRVLVAIAGFALLGAAAQWGLSALCTSLTAGIIRGLRDDAFEKLERLPLKTLDGRPYGEIVSRVISDAERLSDGLLLGFTELFSGVLTIVGTLGFMLSQSVSITLVVVLLTPISLFVAAFIARRTHGMFALQAQARAEQTALVDEAISQAKLTQAFCREDALTQRFDEGNALLRKHSLRAVFYSSITNPATRFVNALVYAGVGVTGALSALSGRISVGTLSCFLSYARQYTKPFNEISGVVAEMQGALACAERLFALLDEPEQPPEPPDARTLEHAAGAVALDKVCFSYVRERPLIENFSLSVKPGMHVAIVGPTGCGKTTLINLLMRFYDVDSGAILLDGCDIRRLTRKSLRRSYGMVLQDTWLRDGTVRENIAIGKPEASEEEIIRAAKAANAHSFIRRLPQGYDTPLKDGGGLSQGQRQLLCIARVMLCLPPVLILDEATSSIDTRTEAKISQAFDALMRGKTSFIVAHRLSTIRSADCILVMRDGSIVETGTHEELLRRGGFYAKLYNAQFEA
ncbi:MAG TPA: ABC transporter ATP-binding protein [Candidatus Aphodomonas merdavium]|nr:ABC transporter ATP-binding protein [Candidatus Aphodomonas merdavium]